MALSAIRNSARSGMADALDADINTGTTETGASVVFEVGPSTAVATIRMQNPAFGAAVNGVLTMEGQPKTDTSATGNASPVDQWSLFDRDNGKVLQGSVGTSGQDINITNLTISAGDAVELTTFTITVPAA